MSRPLAGYHVLDCTDELGVYATKLLADLGADVIRLEPAAGDPMRRFPPFHQGDGRTSLYYAHFNLGKRAVALDWETPAGGEHLAGLVASCHALIESGRPERLLSTRVGEARLRAWRPDLAVVSITPFGLSGPYRDWRGGDLQIAAQSGLLYIRADPDSAPYRPGAEQTAHIASLLAANAALLGLYGQQRTGEGSFVEVSAAFTAALATLQTSNANYLTWKGEVPKRRSAAYQVWETSDGWSTYSASPRQFPSLLALLKRYGAQEDLDSPAYDDIEFRQANAGHIQDVTRRFFKSREKQELFEEAQAIGLHYMPVNTVPEIARDPYLRERGFFREVQLPGWRDKLTFPGTPFHFQGAGAEETRPPPAHAQHNDEVFAEVARPAATGSTRVWQERGGSRWQPLAGIRVLDFSWLIAGPLGTRLLASFGAEVLKVESYHRVDGIRLTGPHPETSGPPNVNEDGSFNDVNLGKKSILLNLSVAEGRAVALKLAAVSDVVAANFTGDRLDRWGLGFEDLRRVKPDIILLSMPVFDGTSERKRWGGVGSDISAISGINAISGFPDAPPTGLGLHYPDFSSNPFHAQAAILSALINRERFGRAQFIEVSQYESTVSLLGPSLLEYFANGATPPRLGNRSLRYSPHNVYGCAGEDRWCAISATNEDEWQALCLALEKPDWLSDGRFAGLAARRNNEDALDALISAAVSDRDAGSLAAYLQQRGVPAAPVNNLADLVADPWYEEQYFTEMDGPEGCVFTAHGEPLRPFGRKHDVTRAPTLGEHTEEVMRGVLGLDDEEISALYVCGALG